MIHNCRLASIVQWLEFLPSKQVARVRFPVDALVSAFSLVAMIPRCQRGGPGSIPGRRIFFRFCSYFSLGFGKFQILKKNFFVTFFVNTRRRQKVFTTGLEPATLGLLDQCSTNWAKRTCDNSQCQSSNFNVRILKEKIETIILSTEKNNFSKKIMKNVC